MSMAQDIINDSGIRIFINMDINNWFAYCYAYGLIYEEYDKNSPFDWPSFYLDEAVRSGIIFG